MKITLVHVDLSRAFQLCVVSIVPRSQLGVLHLLQSDKTCVTWVNGWLLKGAPFYTLVLSILASKKSSFFCGDNPKNYNIKGNVDLKMLIHDKLFLLISQLEKKSYNFHIDVKLFMQYQQWQDL